MTMLVYNIEQINNIRDNGFIFELHEESLDVINNISEIVGASTYIRTPIFPRRERKNKNKDQPVDPNFKSTVINKEENNTVVIRQFLNKITDKNYDVIYEQINKTISEIVTAEKLDELDEITDFIFTTAGSNKAFSTTYAKMYKELINNYEIFNTILKKHLNKHLDMFKVIEVVSPSEDYEKFCVNNRKNEIRRATSMFLSNLYNMECVDSDTLINIIDMLHNSIEIKINEENMAGAVSEIGENSSIIIVNSFTTLLNTEKWEDLKNYILTMKSRKMKEFKSLPSKTIFKYMDIFDKIKDLDK